MKRALLLFLLVLPSFASFYINDIELNFYALEDGNAHVVERYNIVIEGKVDIGRYIAHMEESSVLKWQELLGDKEVRLHVNPLYVGVANLEVKPQPPRAPQGRGNDVVTSALLIIEYDVVPKTAEGESMFFIEKVKPRLYRYTLNTKALSLQRTALGNFLLDERTSLIFHLPKGSVIEKVNPQPYEMGESYVKWRNTVLVKPKLVFLKEISIEEEINAYFQELGERLAEVLSTKEGVAGAVLAFIIISFYIYLRFKVRG